jgi:hypothetical protein
LAEDADLVHHRRIQRARAVATSIDIATEPLETRSFT